MTFGKSLGREKMISVWCGFGQAARSLLGFGDIAAKVDKGLVALINQFEQSFVVFFKPETTKCGYKGWIWL